MGADDYRPPTELAHRVRDRIRTQHASCDPRACPLAHAHAEDIQEILDATGAEHVSTEPLYTLPEVLDLVRTELAKERLSAVAQERIEAALTRVES